MLALAVALVLASGPPPRGGAADAGPAPAPAVDAAARAEVEEAAARLRASVVRRDVGAVMELVGAEGVRCGDERISRDAFRAALERRGTFLHDYFFDGEGLRKRYAARGIPISLLELFQQSTDPVVEAAVPEPAGGGLPVVRFRPAKGFAPEFVFDRRAGSWVLAVSPGCRVSGP